MWVSGVYVQCCSGAEVCECTVPTGHVLYTFCRQGCMFIAYTCEDLL